MAKTKIRCQEKSRRGAVTVLTAILLIPLLAMIAFSFDVAYMVRVKAQLQNAADACALAGALKEMTPQFSGITSSSPGNAIVTAASTAAQNFAPSNSAGQVPLTLLPSDTTVGYLANPTNQQQTLSAWSAGQPLPNSVQVVLRRDNTANTPVNLFFAKVLGYNTWSCTATATAAFLQASTVTGFNSSTINGKLLPIAVDVNLWNSFIATGKSPDGTTSDSYSVTSPSANNPAPGNVTSGGDGIPEFNAVYPNSNSPGNFGLVNIGPPSSATPTFENWILNGPSPADLSYFGSNGLQATPNAPATVNGGPGLKSVLQTYLQDVIGQERIVPLFSSYSGNGSNTQYTIVGFAGVTIVSATGSGSNMQIIVQPIAVVDPTATTGSGSGSSFVYPTTPISLVR
jgi:Flp pilus assembly protein TadG